MMAYFSNGSEGAIYEMEWCARCVHDRSPDHRCMVMVAHDIYNYEHCNDKASILHLLIPRSPDGLGNERCTMFVDSTPLPPPPQEKPDG